MAETSEGGVEDSQSDDRSLIYTNTKPRSETASNSSSDSCCQSGSGCFDDFSLLLPQRRSAGTIMAWESGRVEMDCMFEGPSCHTARKLPNTTGCFKGPCALELLETQFSHFSKSRRNCTLHATPQDAGILAVK